jgi:adenylate kinase family enzyme
MRKTASTRVLAVFRAVSKEAKGGKLKRICVVGTSGAGKTTLAVNIAQKLNMAHIELDALHWDANWRGAPRDVFLQRVREAIGGERWVCSGNYSAVRELTWRAADTIIWLDYAFPVVFGRTLKRTATRIVTQEELWNGNRESWRMALSRNSILLWVLKTHWRRKRETPQLLSQSEYSHLQLLHFQSPRAAQKWLEQL